MSRLQSLPPVRRVAEPGSLGRFKVDAQMKTTRELARRNRFVLLLVSVLFALGSMPFFVCPANAQSTNQASGRFPIGGCCHRVELLGKECTHKCCIGATAAGKICLNCH